MEKNKLIKEVEKWLTENYGKCPDFEKDCIVCQKWKLKNDLFEE